MYMIHVYINSTKLRTNVYDIVRRLSDKVNKNAFNSSKCR